LKDGDRKGRSEKEDRKKKNGEEEGKMKDKKE
jgi:hypothetical protein